MIDRRTLLGAFAATPETGDADRTRYKAGLRKLDDDTDRHSAEGLALAERQAAEMKASFALSRLSPAGQLSYRLAENFMEAERRQFRWRGHEFPISTLDSPA